MVGHTLILSNKKVNIKQSVLAFIVYQRLKLILNFKVHRASKQLMHNWFLKNTHEKRFSIDLEK